MSEQEKLGSPGAAAGSGASPTTDSAARCDEAVREAAGTAPHPRGAGGVYCVECLGPEWYGASWPLCPHILRRLRAMEAEIVRCREAAEAEHGYRLAAEAEVERLTKDLRDVGIMSAAYCGALMPDRDVVTLTPEGLRAARLVKVDVRPRGGARLTLTDTTLGEHLASRDRLTSQPAAGTSIAPVPPGDEAPCETKASASEPPASTGERGGDEARDPLRTYVRGSAIPMLRRVIDDLDAMGHRGLALDLRECRELLHRLSASGERSPRAGTADDRRELMTPCWCAGFAFAASSATIDGVMHRKGAACDLRASPPPRYSGTTASEGGES